MHIYCGTLSQGFIRIKKKSLYALKKSFYLGLKLTISFPSLHLCKLMLTAANPSVLIMKGTALHYDIILYIT